MPGQQSCKLSSANSAQRQLYIVHFFSYYTIYSQTHLYLCIYVNVKAALLYLWRPEDGNEIEGKRRNGDESNFFKCLAVEFSILVFSTRLQLFIFPFSSRGAAFFSILGPSLNNCMD